MKSALAVSERPFQPIYPTRLLNFFGRFVKEIVLDPDELMKNAEKETGLTDWGKDEFREGLELFCQAINEEKQMHYTGKYIVKRTVCNDLAARLKIQQTLVNEPEIIRRPIESPILIPGMARSGTTFLHRLLGADPQFRTTKFWELENPAPPPEPETYSSDSRIKETEKKLRLVFKISPAIAVAHPMEAVLPDECYVLLARSFFRVVESVARYKIPMYSEWLSSRTDEDLMGAYGYHKKQLQILQWRFADVRWVLKSPVHGLWIRAFEKTYPDAKYIFCHREPAQFMPSVCSLAAAQRALSYSQIDFSELGDSLLDYRAITVNRMMDAKKLIVPHRWFDLSFNKLMKIPMETVREIYDFLGVELTSDAEALMIKFMDSQKQGKHHGHKYSLEQFGLDRQRIDKTFERYRDQYNRFF